MNESGTFLLFYVKSIELDLFFLINTILLVKKREFYINKAFNNIYLFVQFEWPGKVWQKLQDNQSFPKSTIENGIF